MELAAGDGWVAVFDRSRPGGYYVGKSYAPVAVWEQRCIGGNDFVVGLVAVDRDGDNLPFLVAATDVPGFLQYEKRG